MGCMHGQRYAPVKDRSANNRSAQTAQHKPRSMGSPQGGCQPTCRRVGTSAASRPARGRQRLKTPSRPDPPPLGRRLRWRRRPTWRGCSWRHPGATPSHPGGASTPPVPPSEAIVRPPKVIVRADAIRVTRPRRRRRPGRWPAAALGLGQARTRRLGARRRGAGGACGHTRGAAEEGLGAPRHARGSGRGGRRNRRLGRAAAGLAATRRRQRPRWSSAGRRGVAQAAAVTAAAGR